MTAPGTVTDPYERHFGLWAREQQLRLSKARVAVGGIGGIGAAQALMLAKTGVGSIRIADRDAYGVENIVEQAFATWDAVGKAKVDAACTEMHRHQQGVDVRGLTGDLSVQEQCDALVTGVDVLFSGVDNPAARLALGRAAGKAGIPMVVSANVGWTVIHTVYLPDQGGYASAWAYLRGVSRDSLGYPDMRDEATRRRVERDWRIWVLALSGFRREAARQYLGSTQEYCWYAAAPAFHAASLGVMDGVKLLLDLPEITRFPEMRVFDLLRNRSLSPRQCALRFRRIAAAWNRGEQAVLDVIAKFETET